MDINPGEETSYTTQYQEAFLKYVENEYCATQRCSPVTEPECVLNHDLIYSAMDPTSGQSFYDPYDMSSDDEEYLMCNNVTET